MRIKRKHIAFMLAVIALLLIICTINLKYKVYAVGNHHNNAVSDGCFTIMTFNVDASDSTKFSTQQQEQILDLVKREAPDVLCFQELSTENLIKIKPQLDSFYGNCDALMGEHQYRRKRLYSHYPIKNFKNYYCKGDIIEDDLNEEEKYYVRIMKSQMNLLSADFEIEPDQWVTVFSGHLRSSGYSAARRIVREDSSWFSGLGLYWRNYRIGKRIRDFEAQNTRRAIDEARAEGKKVIVAGDLNDWSGSDCMSSIAGNDLKDAWWEGGNGFGWTFAGLGLKLRLDHILYSDGLELIDVKVIESTISDHYPLVAKFIMR